MIKMSQKRIKALKKAFRENMGGLTEKVMPKEFKQFKADMEGKTYDEILLQIGGK